MANGRAMCACVCVMYDTVEWMHMTREEVGKGADDGMHDACVNGIVVIRMQKRMKI